jgi:hypothetical protein
MHQGDVSLYVKNADFKEYEEKTVEIDRLKLLMDALKLVDVREFQTTEAYSNVDLTIVKYSTYKQSREENLKVMERIIPNCFMHSESKKRT